MSKLPYFPCYARDVLSSSKIALMGGEAFKAYWLLLCASWLEDERATLPNDQAKLQALARANDLTWLEIKNEVLACFDTNDNGRLFSPRLLEVSLLQEKRREAGSKGGSKTQAKFKANLQASELEAESESELELEPEKEKKEEVATSVPTTYFILSKNFLGAQRLRFLHESALSNSFLDCVSDGAKKLRLFNTKDNWSDELIKELLDWILEDEFWSIQIRTLGGIRIRKGGKGTPMKFENARASMEAPPPYETDLQKYERKRNANPQP